MPRNGVHELENFINHGKYLTGRGGTQHWSDTTLPGSGTIHNWYYHETKGIIVLHRNQSVYTTDLGTISWDTAVCINGTIGDTYTAFDEMGDFVIGFNASGIFNIIKAMFLTEPNSP